MRELKTKLTTSAKGSTNIQTRRGKSFGYQVLGFGAGGSVATVEINYDAIAGGGAGAPGPGWWGHERTGGSGAGGFISNDTVELLEGEQYTITVGGGGPSGETPGVASTIAGAGIDTITAIGGGYGGNRNGSIGGSGGSGGGGGAGTLGGAAGTVGQGNAGGPAGGPSNYNSGGGGGKGGAGTVSNTQGVAGAGATSSIPTTSGTFSTGGTGNGISYTNNSAGGANTGNGASGVAGGGSGRVHLQIPTAKYTGTTTGSPAVSTSGIYTILQYTGTGSYTA